MMSFKEFYLHSSKGAKAPPRAWRSSKTHKTPNQKILPQERINVTTLETPDDVGAVHVQNICRVIQRVGPSECSGRRTNTALLGGRIGFRLCIC